MSDLANNGWVVELLGQLVELRRGITYNLAILDSEKEGLPYINMKSFLKGGGFNHEGTKRYAGIYGQQDLIGEFDLLIANTDVTAGDIVGAPALLPEELVFQKALYSHHVTRLRMTGGITVSFLYHLLCLPAYRSLMLRIARGTTVLMLDTQAIKRIPIRMPKEKTEQRGIAKLLTTNDKAIEKTEFLIAKYQKIKAGLMHDLFTRGVAKDGKLRPRREKAPELYKETPIGWIPREWGIVSIASVSEFITSGSRGWANYYDIEGALFIRIGNLTREHPNFRWGCVQRVRLPKFAEGTRTRVVPGDILISITADLGVAAVAGNDLGEAYVNQHIALVRPCRDVISSRFVGHYLGTRQAQFRFQRLNDSGAKAGLNLTAVGRYLIPRPKDSNEAENIYSILDGIDTKIIALQKDCGKLQMRKSGLMHDLLTGKVPLKVEQESVEMVCG